MEQNAKMEFLKSLNKVQGTMDPVTMDSENPHFKSRYASLAAVNQAIMGPLAEAGFVLLQGGVDIGGKTYLRTTLHHVAGHSESYDYPLIVGDANPQHLASATTYARRYALCAFFNLSTEDDDGNNASQAEVKTVTRESATYTKKKADEKASMPTGEIEVVNFIPSRVDFVDGKGKGSGKVFSEIFDGNKKYSGDEVQGQMAESARASGKTIAVAFKRNGNYLNIVRNSGVKIAPGSVDEIEEVPF